jgi:anti-sigma factor RsiW
MSPIEHVTEDEIALFVLDALALPARERFEGHVAGCGACAQVLAAEAAAEETLVALWPSVRRPLAEVVPLPRPSTRPAPRPVATRAQSSFGGLAAALVAVLFLGWWTDAGRNMVGLSADGAAGALSPLMACLMPGGVLASGEIDEGSVCTVGEDGPPLAALASWGMCTAGNGWGAGRSPGSGTGSHVGRCLVQSRPLCLGPDSP